MKGRSPSLLVVMVTGDCGERGAGVKKCELRREEKVSAAVAGGEAKFVDGRSSTSPMAVRRSIHPRLLASLMTLTSSKRTARCSSIVDDRDLT